MVEFLYPKTRSSKRERVPVSCTECHRRKKKCNRLLPCRDCSDRGIPQLCRYMESSISNTPGVTQAARSAVTNRRFITDLQAVPISLESIDELAGFSETFGSTYFRDEILPGSGYSFGFESQNGEPYRSSKGYGLASTFFKCPQEFSLGFPTVTSGVLSNRKIRVPGGISQYSTLPSIPGEPMPKELLIHYFIARLVPWLSYLDTTLTPTSPRLAWLPFAISHAPLFHATLLAAAVHLNRRKPLKDPGALTWYKLQTIQHANDVLNTGTVEQQASDEMIVVALVLLCFDVREVICTQEFEVHLRGVARMVEVRGGRGGLGMRGIVGNMLGVCYGPWIEGWVEGGF
ncbi:hypothetical protein HYALB_00002519 [Hymenoscyphus albidus]|uniref:Zn(2)-C6 fungal-type domain-containing protein n=1 Tax=Hymenoscyphus albidus TaxID=595503 RepID=A0A9N9QAJ0_9HELO|nr:hypothetical protein HYALB_00002519 [Hymenoscyphus albidus]